MGKSWIATLLVLTFSSQNIFAVCQDSELKSSWPITGTKAKTYNGHNGIDIDLPNFRAIHNADGDTYQTFFNQSTAAGLQLTSLDNYVRKGQPVVAAVFSTSTGHDWRAYHFLNPQQHQQKFDKLRNLGYRPYLMSVTVANNRYYLSSAYTKAPSQGWWALWGMTEQQYQTTMNQQIALGRAPIYVDVYDEGGSPRFSAIWTAEANRFSWIARHNLNEAQFHLVHEQRTQAGMKARIITSYVSNGQRLFAGIWSTAP